MDQDQNEVFESELKNSLRVFRVEGVTEAQIGQLVKHYVMLCKWNRQFNLTRITKPRDAAMLNYAESLYATKLIGHAKSMIDIGSGAGFPAIPIAVALPELSVGALEANQKKSLFLNETKFELQLANLRVITDRAEETNFNSYDLLTCRAIDHAETVVPAIINRLGEAQRLMLYCVKQLADKLLEQFSGLYKLEINPIPESEARVIAVFSRR